jgi:hypothetical protein
MVGFVSLEKSDPDFFAAPRDPAGVATFWRPGDPGDPANPGGGGGASRPGRA